VCLRTLVSKIVGHKNDEDEQDMSLDMQDGDEKYLPLIFQSELTQ
jgi:hypothetical protein